MTTILYGWGPMFDAPSASPYVIKCEVQLQMLGVEFERAIANLDAVKKHKAPYVKDGDELIEDSTFIRDHFEKKLHRDLNMGLSHEQRGVAWAVERMLEDRLTFILLHERWTTTSSADRRSSLRGCRRRCAPRRSKRREVASGPC